MTDRPVTDPAGDGHAGDLVSARLDGELDAETAAWVDEHLAGCTDCRAAAEEAGAARSWLRTLPTEDATPVVSGFLARHRAVVRTGTAFVGAAAVALGAIALTSAVLRPEVVPEIDRLVLAHAEMTQETSPAAGSTESLSDALDGARVVENVAGLYAAPPALLGNRSRLSRRALYDGEDLAVVVYGDGRGAVSVFQQPGVLQWDELPDGAIDTVGSRTVWTRPGSPSVMVAELGGLVVTVVSEDRAAMTTVVHGFPAKDRGSAWDRLHDACVRFTETFAGG